MTKKEDLLFRAALCDAASKRVRGKMRTIWQQKRNELLEMAANCKEGEVWQ